MNKNKPLAYRVRPQKFEDIVGQEHIIGEKAPLKVALDKEILPSFILWGKSGTGKTTIAEIISKTTKIPFKKLNAVTSGVSDIKSVIQESQNILLNPKQKIILFIDEIHRFNKAQQDVLLPYVENGHVTLIGATTENPYFEINSALISRMMVFKLNVPTEKDIINILKKAISLDEGLKKYNVKVDENVLTEIAIYSSGDVRNALNMLELCVISTPINTKGEIIITIETLANTLNEKKQYFQKSGTEHYDTISALIKSIRGSDENAAIHYLARALCAGEDIKFIARRLIILASEDIGLADNMALVIANNCFDAVSKIGMPESRIILAQTVIYLAKAKKSNSAYLAINMAIEDVQNKDIGEIPLHIRNAGKKELKQFKIGEGYLYPHNYKNSIVEQTYMPEPLKNTKYYIKKDNDTV
ncbi:MAG: replication-associated recombination protein A [Clostridium sp.]